MINLDNFAILALTYCVIREVIFWFTTQKLLNKLMSRSFYEYQLGKNLGKVEEGPKKEYDEEEPEDMARFIV